MFKKIHFKLDGILSSIAIIEKKTNALELAKDHYEAEIFRLIKQNADLMDRFMARDFEQLQIYQTEEQPPEMVDLPEDQDDLNAGEVLDLEIKH